MGEAGAAGTGSHKPAMYGTIGKTPQEKIAAGICMASPLMGSALSYFREQKLIRLRVQDP